MSANTKHNVQIVAEFYIYELEVDSPKNNYKILATVHLLVMSDQRLYVCQTFLQRFTVRQKSIKHSIKRCCQPPIIIR